MKTCLVCGVPIPLERLEALPNTCYCINHAPNVKQSGYLVYSHKTAPELLLIPNNPESHRQAKRANRRAR